MTTQEILRAAQGAKLPLALADADTKNAALEAMAVALIAAQDKILDANKQDVENARGRVSDVMLDRLALTPGRHENINTTMVRIAVATFESVFLIPLFAKIEVTPAKNADPTA